MVDLAEVGFPVGFVVDLVEVGFPVGFVVL